MAFKLIKFCKLTIILLLMFYYYFNVVCSRWARLLQPRASQSHIVHLGLIRAPDVLI